MMMNRERISFWVRLVAILLAAVFLISFIFLGIGTNIQYNLFDLFGNQQKQQQQDQTPDPEMDVPAQAEAVLEDQQVHSVLESLPGAQRQVIELAYFQGMTRQEIAQATGEALGTVHTRARLALQKLREELERQKFEG